MQEPNWSILWEVVKGVAAFLGFVASAIGGWVFKKWTQDRAMLLAHEKTLEPLLKTAGELTAWRVTLERDGGQLDQIAQMDAAIEMLTNDVTDLKDLYRERVKYTNAMNDKLTEILQTMASLVATVGQLEKQLNRHLDSK
jgi:hypothetical protein